MIEGCREARDRHTTRAAILDWIDVFYSVNNHWPSFKNIAEALGYNMKVVGRIVRWLESHGYVSVRFKRYPLVILENAHYDREKHCNE